MYSKGYLLIKDAKELDALAYFEFIAALVALGKGSKILLYISFYFGFFFSAFVNFFLFMYY